MKKQFTRNAVITLLVIIISYLSYNHINNLKREDEVKNKIQSTQNLKEAYFAGGCFWCVESAFEKYDGVIDSISGYAGGVEKNPTYIQISRSETGHREAVKVIYDSSLITYDDLLEIFWRTVNPTDDKGQYVDRGFQYTSAIFYTDNKQKELALKSKEKIDNSGRYDEKIITPIIPFTTFYDAEDYHQDYHIKSPVRYNLYTNGSGRKQYLTKIWGDDLDYKLESKSDLESRLTTLQYYVTQENGTEKPFDNKYWDNKKDGIYVDIVNGKPLYSSLDKYESGTGWPSFSKPIDKNNIKEVSDNSLFFKRTEIRGAKSDSHIGHVFNDGPEDKGGLRYCMNSAAMRFIAKEDLEKEGYGEYLELFE